MYKGGGGVGGPRTKKGAPKPAKPSPVPASQGHPSRGGTTVGGGTKTAPTKYKSSTPTKMREARKPALDLPYSRRGAKEAQRNVELRKKLTRRLLLAKPFTNEAKAGLANMYTHPTNLARSNFNSVAKDMWKELGLEGRPPKIVYNDAPKEPGVAAYAYRGRNAVFIEPGTAENAQFDRGKYTTYAHEAAHTRQSEKDKSKARIEGGAEEFAKIVGTKALKKIGIKGAKFRYASPEYKKYSRKVRRRRGKRYITKGQFEER